MKIVNTPDLILTTLRHVLTLSNDHLQLHTLHAGLLDLLHVHLTVLEVGAVHLGLLNQVAYVCLRVGSRADGELREEALTVLVKVSRGCDLCVYYNWCI